MSLQLHKPDGRGGIEPRTVVKRDWRQDLRSLRWGSGLRSRRPVLLKNPEMNPTPSWMAAAFWVSLAVATFVLLLLGYGTHFWRFVEPK
jgi:hypothetical protein